MKKPSLLTKLTVGALTLGLGATFVPIAQANNGTTPDGLSSSTAAASCFEIKQNNPDSESGTYWLWTPQMDAPAQFYCDQETAGGGWVMIGRGRDGWTESYTGKGKPSELYNNPDGTDAFSPVQLSSETVTDLLGGKRVDELADGVRFTRAGNVEGTVWQNMYATRSRTESWNWTLSAYHYWTNLRYDNDPTMGGDFSLAMSESRLNNFNSFYLANNFYAQSHNGWKLGFAYGQSITGSSAADSYLWSQGTQGYAIPFTQVYLRPQITQADFNLTAYSQEGTAEVTQRSLPSSFSSKVTWRTSPTSGTGRYTEMNTRVQAINQLGDTVFTGGDFEYVEHVSGEKVYQKFIAGYNVNTGELVRSFTPQLNGQVKAIEPLPNGKLAVGGEFTQVNGQPANGFVILDPITGEVDTSMGWDIVNRTTGGKAFVKSIDVHNGYVYIGGSFTHVKGATSATYAYSRNVARYRLSNNGVDWNWRPITNGTVNGVSASDEGVAIGGYFTTVNDKYSWKLAYLDSTTGALAQDWTWKLSYKNDTRRASDGFQFDVQDAGNSIWAGGAEHLVAQYDKSNLSNRLSTAITKSGGDFQDLSLNSNGVLFAACHCGDWIYSNASDFNKPWLDTATTAVNMVRLVAAFDAQTGEILPQFNPVIQGAKGHGVWATFTDSTGTLWVGGDITRSLGYSGTQATVGFARYAPNDSKAPAVARNLQVTAEGSNHKLTWTGVSERGVTYQILRNDRVVASTTSTSIEIPAIEDATYFVRVADVNGNISASTAGVLAPAPEVVPTPEPTVEPTVEPTEEPTVEPTANPSVAPIEEITEQPTPPVVEENPDPAPPVDPVEPVEPADVQLVSSGDNWDVTFRLFNKYDRTWRNLDYSYNTATWYSGKSSIGWGEFSLATRVQFGWTGQPMSMMLRKEIQLTPQANQELVLTTYADDGIAIYVNGSEVHRSNLIANALPNTAASSPVIYSLAKATPITVKVPASQLKTGKNVIAVEVHSASRSDSATFDLEAVLSKA